VAVTTAAATCPNGDAVAFHNVPLTTISVTVDSLVVGGTSSVITCTGSPAVTTPASGDGSLEMPSLGAGTSTCTVVVQSRALPARGSPAGQRGEPRGDLVALARPAGVLRILDHALVDEGSR
jgi:hypothetical protein